MDSFGDLAEMPGKARNSPNISHVVLPPAYGAYPPYRRRELGSGLQLTRSKPPRWSFFRKLWTKYNSSRRTLHAPTLQDIPNVGKRFGLVAVYALNKYEIALVFGNMFPANEARCARAECVEASFEAICLASKNHNVPRWLLIRQTDDLCLHMINEDDWCTLGRIFNLKNMYLGELFFYVVLGALCTTSQGVYHAFHLLANMKSDLYASEVVLKRQWSMEIKKAVINTAVTKQMKNLLNGFIARTPNANAPIQPLPCKLPQFWNCASVRRKLLRLGKYECDNRRRELELLEVLQKRAWSEIRFNTYLTCALWLPTELVEIVFEYALKTEGISIDPRIAFHSQKSK